MTKPRLLRAAVNAGLPLFILVAAPQVSIAAPFCVVGSLNFGSPDCNYWTWRQCRASLGGVGDYCEPNTRGPYVFDLSDPGNPRVVEGAPRRRNR